MRSGPSGTRAPLPGSLRDALLGGSFALYAWIWLVTGMILIATGPLVLGPSDRPSAEMSWWVGIVATSLGAISAMFLVPYYPVWALISLGLAALAIYGLAAHYGEKPDRWSVARDGSGACDGH